MAKKAARGRRVHPASGNDSESGADGEDDSESVFEFDDEKDSGKNAWDHGPHGRNKTPLESSKTGYGQSANADHPSGGGYYGFDTNAIRDEDSDAGVELFMDAPQHQKTHRAIEMSFIDLDDDEDDVKELGASGNDRNAHFVSSANQDAQFAHSAAVHVNGNSFSNGQSAIHDRNVPMQNKGRATLPGKGENTNKISSDNDSDDEDESVDMLGIDDGAEELLGIKNLPGAGGVAFMNPELEKRVEKMAQVIKHYKEQNKALREKQSVASEEVKRLRNELERLEDEKEEAELKAERELRMIQFKNLGGGAGPGGGRHLATDLEAQRKREEARRQMYAANNDQGDDYEALLGLQDTVRSHGIITLIRKRFARIIHKYDPLQKDVRRVEARFGSSVAAYFYFFRWMIANYMILMLIGVIFLIRHLVALFSYQNLSEEDRQLFYNSANEPELAYDWTSSDWSSLSSFLPKFLMLSSFNPGDSGTQYIEDNLFSGTPIYNATGSEVTPIQYHDNLELGERMDYISILIFCNLIVLGSVIRKWILEDRRAKAFGLFEDLDKQSRFAQSALNAWDHSLRDPREVEDLKHSLLDQYFLSVHELHTDNLKKSRTFKERLNLLLRRIVSNMVYLGVQGSSAYAIIYLTATSSQMSSTVLQIISDNSSLQWLLPVVTLISGSIVPLAVSVINALLPTVAKILTSFEKWDDAGFHTKLMLFRLFVAKILNALIQVTSFLQLLDPYLLRGAIIISQTFDLTARTNTEKRLTSVGSTYGSEGTIPRGLDECRADYYGAGIFQLVLTEFVISKSTFAIIPAVKYVISKLRKKPFEPGEFHVAKHMVDLLFFQQLCFVSFPFFPFGTFFVGVMMFVGFKVQVRTLMAFMQKPKKPWSAKDAANFFIKFFFFTYAVSFVVFWYILSSNTLPKTCTLQEHVIQASFGGLDPMDECFNDDPGNLNNTLTCFMNGRTVEEIRLAENRAPGLEELRFWEEYFVASVPDGTFSDNQTIDTEGYLRDLLGYPSSTAVGFPSLATCSLSCGPFVYSVNYYSTLDIYLTSHIETFYKLLTQTPLFVWGIAILLALRYLFMKNTIGVLYELQQEKEISLRNLVANLESKIKKLTTRLNKMKNE